MTRIELLEVIANGENSGLEFKASREAVGVSWAWRS
jgi:hypothetical protein